MYSSLGDRFKEKQLHWKFTTVSMLRNQAELRSVSVVEFCDIRYNDTAFYPLWPGVWRYPWAILWLERTLQSRWWCSRNKLPVYGRLCWSGILQCWNFPPAPSIEGKFNCVKKCWFWGNVVIVTCGRMYHYFPNIISAISLNFVCHINGKDTDKNIYIVCSE